MPKKKPNKTIGKIGVRMLEESAGALDSFRIPLLKEKQERLVRRVYKEAHKSADIFQLPRKTYKRINSKGELEELG